MTTIQINIREEMPLIQSLRTWMEPLESRALLSSTAASLIGISASDFDTSNIAAVEVDLSRAGATTPIAPPSQSNFIGIGPSPVYNPARFDNSGVAASGLSSNTTPTTSSSASSANTTSGFSASNVSTASTEFLLPTPTRSNQSVTVGQAVGAAYDNNVNPNTLGPALAALNPT